MQQIQIPEFSGGFRTVHRLFRRKLLLAGGEHQTGATVVAGRVGDIELDSERGELARLHHGEIVGRPLIGPAAFAVVEFFIAESHIEGRFEVYRDGAGRRDPEPQVQRRLLECARNGIGSETEHEMVVAPLAVVLDQQREVAFDGDGSSVQLELQAVDLAAAEELDALERCREFDFPSVDQHAGRRGVGGQIHHQCERPGFDRRIGFEPGGIGDRVLFHCRGRDGEPEAVPRPRGFKFTGVVSRETGSGFEAVVSQYRGGPVGGVAGPAQREFSDLQIAVAVHDRTGRKQERRDRKQERHQYFFHQITSG